jgi:hypothetical protein
VTGPPAVACAEDDPEISLLTIAPGRDVFAAFGHTALLLREPGQRRGLVFNYGTFGIPRPSFLWAFLRGRPVYWLSVSPLDVALHGWRTAGRSVSTQRLRLPPGRARALALRMYDDARPERASYIYDHFTRNCTTQARDLIDWAADGALRRRAPGPAALTRRHHVDGLAVGRPGLSLGLLLALGAQADERIDRWSEMFLPAVLQEALARDPALADPPTWLFETAHPAAAASLAASVACRWPAMLLALLLPVLAWRAPVRAARRLVAAATIAMGSSLGLAGSLLAALSLLTSYQATARNTNVLQFAPWALGVLWLSRGLRTGDQRSWGRAIALFGGAAAASLLGLASWARPGPGQDNGRVIAVLLPLWLGVTAALVVARRRLPGSGTGGDLGQSGLPVAADLGHPVGELGARPGQLDVV